MKNYDQVRLDNACYRAEQIVENFRVHLRNGGFEAIKRDDLKGLQRAKDDIVALKQANRFNQNIANYYISLLRYELHRAANAPRKMNRSASLLTTSVKAAGRRSQLRLA